jgi:FKBP-type peptidyl-prolyl cis-trans isomerase SlyD
MCPQVISFNCTLKNAAGRLISQTYNREVLNAVAPGQGGTLSGLNKNLQNLKKGERRRFTVPAEEAYGLYDPKKVILFPRRKLPRSVTRGEIVNIAGSSSIPQAYRVIEFHEEFARLDGNHPLAGQDLIFEIEALEARDATPEDLELSTNRVANQLLH